MGRAKYKEWITEEGLAQIQLWRKKGLELQEIAKNMGIRPATLSDWQRDYPEIAQAIKRGQEVAVQIVENALFKSAIGYGYQEVTHELVRTETPRKDADGIEMDGVTDTKEEMKVTKVVEKFQAPNATSIIFLLKNLDPDNYKDRRENHISGSLGRGPDLSNLSTEDIQQAIQDLKSAAGDSDGKGS